MTSGSQRRPDLLVHTVRSSHFKGPPYDHTFGNESGTREKRAHFALSGQQAGPSVRGQTTQSRSLFSMEMRREKLLSPGVYSRDNASFRGISVVLVVRTRRFHFRIKD